MAPFYQHLMSACFLNASLRRQQQGGYTMSRLHASTPLSTTNTNKNMADDGECVFGKKEYWDSMYEGTADRPKEVYSWYCGWDELAPFWKELVPDKDRSILIAGMGNDPTPVEMYDEGYTGMTAFDYSQAGVDRAKELLGPNRQVHLLSADAKDLHSVGAASIDAVLDKGTLDAIYISGVGNFQDSVRELERVTAPEGVVVCISRVILASELLQAFDNPFWENIHDGSLAFAPDGEATIDLGAELYSWRRTETVWD